MSPDKAAQLGNDLCCLAASIAEIGEELKSLYDHDAHDRSEDHDDPGSVVADIPEPDVTPAASAPTPDQPAAPTLIDVRTMLSKKSSLGFQEAVRELITRRGATKLSEIPQSEYPSMMAEAEALK